MNVKTEVEDDGKWQRRIMVLSSLHHCLFFWPGTRKYPKGKVSRVRGCSPRARGVRANPPTLPRLTQVHVALVEQLDMSTVISVRAFTGFAVEGFVWHLHATEGRDLYALVATEADCRTWVRSSWPRYQLVPMSITLLAVWRRFGTFGDLRVRRCILGSCSRSSRR